MTDTSGYYQPGASTSTGMPSVHGRHSRGHTGRTHHGRRGVHGRKVSAHSPMPNRRIMRDPWKHQAEARRRGPAA